MPAQYKIIFSDEKSSGNTLPGGQDNIKSQQISDEYSRQHTSFFVDFRNAALEFYMHYPVGEIFNPSSPDYTEKLSILLEQITSLETTMQAYVRADSRQLKEYPEYEELFTTFLSILTRVKALINNHIRRLYSASKHTRIYDVQNSIERLIRSVKNQFNINQINIMVNSIAKERSGTSLSLEDPDLVALRNKIASQIDMYVDFVGSVGTQIKAEIIDAQLKMSGTLDANSLNDKLTSLLTGFNNIVGNSEEIKTLANKFKDKKIDDFKKQIESIEQNSPGAAAAGVDNFSQTLHATYSRRKYSHNVLNSRLSQFNKVLKQLLSPSFTSKNESARKKIKIFKNSDDLLQFLKDDKNKAIREKLISGEILLYINQSLPSPEAVKVSTALKRNNISFESKDFVANDSAAILFPHQYSQLLTQPSDSLQGAFIGDAGSEDRAQDEEFLNNFSNKVIIDFGSKNEFQKQVLSGQVYLMKQLISDFEHKVSDEFLADIKKKIIPISIKVDNIKNNINKIGNIKGFLGENTFLRDRQSIDNMLSPMFKKKSSHILEELVVSSPSPVSVSDDDPLLLLLRKDALGNISNRHNAALSDKWKSFLSTFKSGFTDIAGSGIFKDIYKMVNKKIIPSLNSGHALLYKVRTEADTGIKAVRKVLDTYGKGDSKYAELSDKIIDNINAEFLIIELRMKVSIMRIKSIGDKISDLKEVAQEPDRIWKKPPQWIGNLTKDLAGGFLKGLLSHNIISLVKYSAEEGAQDTSEENKEEENKEDFQSALDKVRSDNVKAIDSSMQGFLEELGSIKQELYSLSSKHKGDLEKRLTSRSPSTRMSANIALSLIGSPTNLPPLSGDPKTMFGTLNQSISAIKTSHKQIMAWYDTLVTYVQDPKSILEDVANTEKENEDKYNATDRPMNFLRNIENAKKTLINKIETASNADTKQKYQEALSKIEPLLSIKQDTTSHADLASLSGWLDKYDTFIEQ